MSEDLSRLDAEALALFRASASQDTAWDYFTARQKQCWRAVATKARELHGRRFYNREDVEAAAKHGYEVDHYYGTPWDEASDLEKMIYRDRAGVFLASLERRGK